MKKLNQEQVSNLIEKLKGKLGPPKALGSLGKEQQKIEEESDYGEEEEDGEDEDYL